MAGRKPLSPENRRTQRLLVAMTTAQRARLEQFATEAGLTLADYLLSSAIGKRHRGQLRKPAKKIFPPSKIDTNSDSV
jgi:hypothetical protein